jgi:hypothetical protein
MKGLIVFRTDNYTWEGGVGSVLRDIRNIPDKEAERLKNEMSAAGFKVFDFQEGDNA